ncbi:MAG: TlpA disulfide reductase family protein [Rhodospirillaceae bacterium]
MTSRKPRISPFFSAVAASLLLGFGIVTIPAGIASAADGVPAACRPSGEGFANFAVRDTPGAAPDARFQAADGHPLTISEIAKRRGAVVNFWAIWCAPCIREMPQLDRLKAELAKDGFAVIAVSQDRGGVEEVETFYEKKGYKHLDIYVDKAGKFARALKIRGLPTTILFDRMGRELVRVQGVAEWDAPKVADYIRRCLADPPPPAKAG